MDWRDEEMKRRNAGQIRALSQNAHEAINARHYPGTRQLCIDCDEPTGRCEEDSIYVEFDGIEYGPVCEDCRTRLDDEPHVEPILEAHTWRFSDPAFTQSFA
jgi:hypothetical protein